MEVNQHLIQFSGKFEIPEPIDTEKYVLCMGEFDISKTTDTPTQEGKVDRMYTIFPTRVEIRQGEARLFGKPKKRGSQRLRGAMWHEYQKINNPPFDFETYYDDIINKLIISLPEVLGFIGQ